MIGKAAVNTIPGLSPRVRGNQKPLLHVGPRPRSIPACAGEPEVVVSAHCGTSVYPRVCGGTPLPERAQVAALGLSPRVRGNRP